MHIPNLKIATGGPSRADDESFVLLFRSRRSSAAAGRRRGVINLRWARVTLPESELNSERGMVFQVERRSPDLGEDVSCRILGFQVLRRMRSKMRSWILLRSLTRPSWLPCGQDRTTLCEGGRLKKLKEIFEEFFPISDIKSDTTVYLLRPSRLTRCRGSSRTGC